MLKISVNTLEKDSTKYFLRFCLLIYLIVLFWLLFIGLGATDRNTYFVNPDDHFLPFYNSYNMIRRAKLWGYKKEYVYPVIWNIVGNIALFLPWGVVGPLVFRKLNSLKKVAITASLISLSAEVIQYCFSIGIFDADDIIYNTLGACIGFCFLLIISYLFPTFRKVFHINRDSKGIYS
jgi:glycopeptide antibiotics resistance protein